MSPRRTALVRSLTVGCALAAAVAAGTAPAAAAPGDGPAFTTNTFRTDFFSGDPFPFAYENLDAAVDGTGVVRLAAGEMCNALAPRCAGYSRDLSVRWINFSTGANGSVIVGQSPTTVTTGRGPVGITVAHPYLFGVPAFGLINP